MEINFELYKIFYFTAKNLSFTKAAKELFVTQSSISQSIKSLESKLNVILFIRSKKIIELTKEGILLFSHVEQSYKHIKLAEKKLENFNIGEINIGASDTICKYFLLPFFKDFHRKHPDIKINIINQPSKATLSMIQNGLMDFGIVSISENTSFENIDLIKIKDYSEVCIASELFFNKIGENATLKDLIKYPMITLRNNTNTRIFLDKEFNKRNLLLEPEFEMVSVDLIIEMVKAELGIGFAMEDTLRDVNKNLFKINITPSLPTRNISFAINSNYPLPEATKLFVNHITNLT